MDELQVGDEVLVISGFSDKVRKTGVVTNIVTYEDDRPMVSVEFTETEWIDAIDLKKL